MDAPSIISRQDLETAMGEFNQRITAINAARPYTSPPPPEVKINDTVLQKAPILQNERGDCGAQILSPGGDSGGGGGM